MRAAVMRGKKLVVDNIPTPGPGAGEVLVKTRACGICGSDLHTLKHAEKLVAAARKTGGPFVMDLARDIVMGHEFCAEVVDYGPGSQKRFKPGTRVCSMPVLIRSTGVETVTLCIDPICRKAAGSCHRGQNTHKSNRTSCVRDSIVT